MLKNNIVSSNCSCFEKASGYSCIHISMKVFVIQSFLKSKQTIITELGCFTLSIHVSFKKIYEFSKQIHFSKIKMYLSSTFLFIVNSYRFIDTWISCLMGFIVWIYLLQNVDVVEKHIYNVNLRDSIISSTVYRPYFLTNRVCEESIIRNLF